MPLRSIHSFVLKPILKPILKSLLKTFSILSIFALGGIPLGAETPTAWQELAARDDTSSVSTSERRILQVLTPEQARAYADGEAPESLILPSGETLADFLRRIDQERAAGLAVKPVEPCVLFDEEVSRERALFLRRADLGGCGIDDPTGEILKSHQTRALMLSLEVSGAVTEGRIKIWPGGGAPEPDRETLAFPEGPESISIPTLIVPICDEESLAPCEDGDLKLAVEGSSARVRLTMHGRLEPVSPRFVPAENPESAGADEGTEKAAGDSPWIEGTNSVHYLGGRVGIGTTSPAADLHAEGSVLVREPGFSGAGSPSGEDLLFRVWGHHPARIEQSYSLGINDGTVPYFAPQDPTLTLLRGSTTRGATLALGNQSANFYLYANHQALRLYAPDGATAIQTLTPSGRVGLGSDAPNSKLVVTHDQSVGGDSKSTVTIDAQSAEASKYALTLRALDTPGSPRYLMRIRGDGNVAIGQQNLDDEARFHVRGAYSDDPQNHIVRVSAAGSGNTLGLSLSETHRVPLLQGYRTHDGGRPIGISLNPFGGDVGVGTEQPTERLDVSGNVKVSGDLKLSGNLVSSGDLCIGQCG